MADDTYLGVKRPKNWDSMSEQQKKNWETKVRTDHIKRRPKTEEDILNDPEQAVAAIPKPQNITVNVGAQPAQQAPSAQSSVDVVRKEMDKDKRMRVADALAQQFSEQILTMGNLRTNPFGKRIYEFNDPEAEKLWETFHGQLNAMPEQNREASIRVFMHKMIPYFDKAKDPDFLGASKRDDEE
jgi:hypothetical protein